MMDLLSLLRTPAPSRPGGTATTGDPAGGPLALAFLIRPAVPGPATEVVDRVAAAVVLGRAAVALALSPVAARWRAR
jgi:hypothetical protein